MMKLSSDRNRLLTWAVLALAGVVAVGCSKQTRAHASATAEGAYNDTKAAMSSAWESVKSFSFEKRDDFTAGAKALSAKMEAQVSEVRANYSDAKASASRKAAMDELRNSEADFKEKMNALGSASAATWESAKNNVIASWDRLQAAYFKAKAE
jgi:hypothetical protein